VGFRQLERFLVGASGVVFIALAVLAVELVPGAAGWVVGVPLGAIGATVLWATVARWSPEAGSAGRRESPELLLPVERLFLLPVVALATAGLVAVLRDSDLNPGIQLMLLATTALILAVTGGFAAGVFRLPPPYPDRRDRQGAAPDGEGDAARRRAQRLRAKRARRGR
jgi:hypothetical protein